MSQFFKNRPGLKVLAALGASCVPLYVASISIGPSYGKLIDLKMKEEQEQLQKENKYDPHHWRVRLLDNWKQSFRSPIAYEGKLEDRFMKEIANAEGETPKGFEDDFKTHPGQDSKEVQAEIDDAADTPDKETKHESAPVTSSSEDTGTDTQGADVDENTTKPTAQQKVHNTSEEEDKQGRNPVAENANHNEDQDKAPSKKVVDDKEEPKEEQQVVAQTTVQGVVEEEEPKEAPYASTSTPIQNSASIEPKDSPKVGSTDPADTVKAPEGVNEELDNAIEPVIEIQTNKSAPHHETQISE